MAKYIELSADETISTKEIFGRNVPSVVEVEPLRDVAVTESEKTNERKEKPEWQ